VETSEAAIAATIMDGRREYGLYYHHREQIRILKKEELESESFQRAT